MKYLAPYIFRIALSNNRIERVANDAVTFRYTDGKTGAKKRATLPVDTFISRFLAHVLPKGFVKVRYYGLLCPGKRQLLNEARNLLRLQQVAGKPPAPGVAPGPTHTEPDGRCCPTCGREMQLVQTLVPQRRHAGPPEPVPQPMSRGPPPHPMCPQAAVS